MRETSQIIEAQLPFDPRQNDVVISQGFDGPYSHNRFAIRTCQYDLRYALDFALPLGTTVKAVRRGIVRFVIQGRGSYSGSDPIEGRKVVAASIIISHPDIKDYPGTVYSHLHHLDADNLWVEDGEAVEAGQPLAKTGLTGWVGEVPHLHLHFQTHESRPIGPLVTSLPFTLKGYDGPLNDEEILRHLMGDSREQVQKILAERKRDGLLSDK